jgi:hypothetical protein
VDKLVKLEVFRPEIAVVVPDVPDEMIDAYVRHACIEFAERTGCLSREYHLDAQECVTDYLLDDCEEHIYRLHSVTLIDSCGEETAPFSAQSGCSTTGCHGSSARFEPPRLLVITPAPATSVEGGIIIRAAVTPTPDACEVDEVFYRRHNMAIVAGALSKLLLIPGKGFNPALAKIHYSTFDAAKTRQVVQANMGYGQGRIDMQFKRFV